MSNRFNWKANIFYNVFLYKNTFNAVDLRSFDTKKYTPYSVCRLTSLESRDNMKFTIKQIEKNMLVLTLGYEKPIEVCRALIPDTQEGLIYDIKNALKKDDTAIACLKFLFQCYCYKMFSYPFIMVKSFRIQFSYLLINYQSIFIRNFTCQQIITANSISCTKT